jgi:hypothetical protein
MNESDPRHLLKVDLHHTNHAPKDKPMPEDRLTRLLYSSPQQLSGQPKPTQLAHATDIVERHGSDNIRSNTSAPPLNPSNQPESQPNKPKRKDQMQPTKRRPRLPSQYIFSMSKNNVRAKSAARDRPINISAYNFSASLFCSAAQFFCSYVIQRRRPSLPEGDWNGENVCILSNYIAVTPPSMVMFLPVI